MNFLKKSLCISACFLLGLGAVGCSDNTKKTTIDKSSYVDIRLKKMFNQQQALLLFTTENPDGSIISVKLTSVDGKYYYIVDGTNRKNVNRKVYLIDASNGKILRKENKGLLDKTSITGFIDFVPVMDIDKAGEIASKFVKDKDCYQIVGYDLYSENDKNVYQIIFSNGDDKNPKTETVYIDGVTGKQINFDSNSDDSDTDSTDNSSKSSKKIDPIISNYLKSGQTDNSTTNNNRNTANSTKPIDNNTNKTNSTKPIDNSANKKNK